LVVRHRLIAFAEHGKHRGHLGLRCEIVPAATSTAVPFTKTNYRCYAQAYRNDPPPRARRPAFATILSLEFPPPPDVQRLSDCSKSRNHRRRQLRCAGARARRHWR
jgi:hypothetical protein